MFKEIHKQENYLKLGEFDEQYLTADELANPEVLEFYFKGLHAEGWPKKLLENLQIPVLQRSTDPETSANGLLLSGLDEFKVKGDIHDIVTEYRKNIERPHMAKVTGSHGEEKRFFYDEWDRRNNSF